MGEGDQQTSEALALQLNELGQRMERLKQLYEQYFMGIERLEPMVARKEVTRTMLTMQQTYIRNTALRFKFNTMLQKWNIYLTYWTRTLREIENGTYVRHIQKAQRAAERKGRELPTEMKKRVGSTDAEIPAAKPELTERAPIPQAPVLQPPQKAPPIPGAKAPPPIPGAKPAPPPIPGARPSGAAPPVPVAARPTAPPLPASARPTVPPVPTPPPRPTAVPGMDESELRALHKKYQDARMASGDSAPVRYESLVASLAKQVPRMLEQPGVRGVSFDVSIKDGKPVLKAIPKK